MRNLVLRVREACVRVCVRVACAFVEFEKFALKCLEYELMETLCLARASKPIDQT